ncbi:MAG TPA: hypothetical protein VHA78_00015 [Candidatus Peribacteraceae bacterium]|nr:hypothetical protein [Candidatus Peribacteraceae bacterium]
MTLLSACTLPFGTSTTGSGAVASESNASVPVTETQNVTYQGMLEPAGITIFMEGTHKLNLADGRFIMLRSAAINLDQYNGKNVEVFGAVRPTKEAGGIIMDVQTVTDLTPSSSSVSSSSESSMSESSESSTSSTSAMSSVESSKQSSSVMSSAISSATPSSAATSSVAASSSAYQGSTELTDKAAVMAKDNMTASLWTQQYCSGTAGFCVPIHKNWYYRGFGATATTLWHVEVGPTDVNNIGDGPLIVNLMSGSLDSVGASDGQVKVQNGQVIGYHSWSENRHFEIIAPANLQTAVTFMIANLKIAGAQ